MRRLAVLALLPILAACGGGDPAPAAAPSDEPTFPGGNALSSYEGSPTYEWRVRITERQGELLALIQRQQPNADEGEFRDILNTCDALREQGLPRPQVVRDAVTRFGDDSSPITLAQARELVTLSESVCP